MKNLSHFLLIVLLLFLPIIGVAQTYNTYNIYMKASNSDRPKKELGKGKHRTPTRPIPCTVSESGIEFAISADDITGYELWDADGEICLGVYSDDVDAANHIFSIPGEYQLVIETQESSYVGFISTL